MADTGVLEVLDQFELDTKYLEDHTADWIDQYSDCWVAVYKEKLLGHGATYTELMENVHPTGKVRNMAVEYISKNPPLMLL